jgi:hypothetical protein
MQKYHKYILPRTKIDIFVWAKFASSSQCKFDSNTPIFSLICHELHELREFYKRCLEMEIFCGTPLVLQTAVIIPHTQPNWPNNSQMNCTVPENYLCNIWMLQRILINC